MVKAPVSLTSLSEAQRAQAYARFEILCPALEEGVPQAQIARLPQLSKSSVQRWAARFLPVPPTGLGGVAQGVPGATPDHDDGSRTPGVGRSPRGAARSARFLASFTIEASATSTREGALPCLHPHLISLEERSASSWMSRAMRR